MDKDQRKQLEAFNAWRASHAQNQEKLAEQRHLQAVGELMQSLRNGNFVLVADTADENPSLNFAVSPSYVTPLSFLVRLWSAFTTD